MKPHLALRRVGLFYFWASVPRLCPVQAEWRSITRSIVEGVVGSNLITPLFGWALLLALLFARGHRRTLRALSGVSFAAATVLLMVALLAVLDALQLRAQVQADRLLRFDIAALETLGKTSLVGGTLVLLALGGWKASRKQKTRTEAVDPIVFTGGSTSGSPPATDTRSPAVAHPSA